MTESEIDVEEADTDLHDRLNDLVDGLQLRTINLIRYSGDLPFEGPIRHETIRMHSEPSMYRYQDEAPVLECRISRKAEFVDQDEDVIATIECDFVAVFEVVDPTIPQDPEVTTAFIDHNVVFMVWPYVREAIQSMSVRLGLDTTVLGVMLHDDTPESVAIIRR